MKANILGQTVPVLPTEPLEKVQYCTRISSFWESSSLLLIVSLCKSKGKKGAGTRAAPFLLLPQ